MDFMNRGMRSGTDSQPAVANPVHHSGRFDKTRGMRIASVALLFSITVLLIALISSFLFGSNGGEGRFVDKKKLQAVFLNGGQVYFGQINSLNQSYLRLNNIYYLRVNQQVQPGQTNNTAQQDISLVKLGCELHGPTDDMVINRQQVIFWENLKDDGQVAKAVAKYKEQNPNGQQCTQPAQTTPSSSQNQ